MDEVYPLNRDVRSRLRLLDEFRRKMGDIRINRSPMRDDVIFILNEKQPDVYQDNILVPKWEIPKSVLVKKDINMEYVLDELGESYGELIDDVEDTPWLVQCTNTGFPPGRVPGHDDYVILKGRKYTVSRPAPSNRDSRSISKVFIYPEREYIEPSWLEGSLDSSYRPSKLIYNRGVFLSIAGSTLLVSSTGSKFKSITYEGLEFVDVYSNDNIFLVLADEKYGVSNDGYEWHFYDLPYKDSFIEWRYISSISGLLVLMSGSGDITYTYKENAWSEPQYVFDYPQMGGLSYGNQFLFTVQKEGGYRLPFIGTHPLAWDEIKLDVSVRLTGSLQWFGYQGQYFFIVDDSGYYNLSKDGRNWEKLQLPGIYKVINVSYANGGYCMFTSSNVYLFSTDALDWEEKTIPDFIPFSAVYGNGRIVLLGNEGKFLYTKY